MRHMKNPQLHFGEVNIADIHIDARSRDDVPILSGGTEMLLKIRYYIHPNNR